MRVFLPKIQAPNRGQHTIRGFCVEGLPSEFDFVPHQAPIIPSLRDKTGRKHLSPTGIHKILAAFFEQTLRDRSRVVPRSDSACVFTERFLRSGNAGFTKSRRVIGCLLYTSDAADEEDSVDLGGRRII